MIHNKLQYTFDPTLFSFISTLHYMRTVPETQCRTRWNCAILLAWLLDFEDYSVRLRFGQWCFFFISSLSTPWFLQIFHNNRLPKWAILIERNYCFQNDSPVLHFCWTAWPIPFTFRCNELCHEMYLWRLSKWINADRPQSQAIIRFQSVRIHVWCTVICCTKIRRFLECGEW